MSATSATGASRAGGTVGPMVRRNPNWRCRHESAGGDHTHVCCLKHGHAGPHRCGVMRPDDDYDGDNPRDRTQCCARWPNTVLDGN